MVDSMVRVKDTSNSDYVGFTQWSIWHPGAGVFGNGWGYNQSLSLRHMNRANVWFPDGHVSDWGVGDVRNAGKLPGAGVLNTAGNAYVFGYSFLD